ETLSMVLLTFLLLAYYPFRRHDGQLLVLCMLGYAAHRFINESIRIEPSYALGLTLSQWGSVVIAAAAVGAEARGLTTKARRSHQGPPRRQEIRRLSSWPFPTPRYQAEPGNAQPRGSASRLPPTGHGSPGREDGRQSLLPGVTRQSLVTREGR